MPNSFFKPRKCPSIRFSDPMRMDVEKETVKLRDVVNGYLQVVSKELDKDLLRMHGEHIALNLRLNNRGICGFYYNQFCIVIEVPPDSSSFFIYTVVHMIDRNEDDHELANLMMQKALELNYLGQGTNGATISLDENSDSLEYTLSFFQEIMGLDYTEFANIVMNFTKTAKIVHEKLALAEEELLEAFEANDSLRSVQQRRLTI